MKTLKLLFILFIGFFSFKPAHAQLDASFYYADSCFTGPGFIQFVANNCNYDNYFFEFGDGNTYSSSSCGTDYQYANPGSYDVILTVTSAGQIASDTQTIQVLPPNQVFFTHNGGGGCSVPQTFTFNGVETSPNNPIIDWYWMVDNQFVGSTQNLTYTFNQPGSYTVQLDGYTANGCFSTDIQTITVGVSSLSANPTYTIITENCQGATVDLIANPTGGTPPYSYQWTWYDFGASTIENPTGQYIINSADSLVYLTITDANGCSFNTFLVIPNSGNNIFASLNATPSTSCGNNCDGSINVVATGGQGPYTFELNNGNTINGNQADFTNLCEGYYSVTVYDQMQCSQTYNAYVPGDSLNQLYLDAVGNNGSICTGSTACQGSIEAYAFGGTPPYQYSLDGGITNQSSSTFSGLCPDAYVVQVTDANACVSIYTVLISTPDSISVVREEYYADCQNDTINQGSSSFIGVNPQGGSGSYTYTWSDGSTQSYILNPTPGTTYTVAISDGSGCTVSETFNVPTTNCYTISGHVYVDVNNNCVFDSTDYPVNCFVDLTATAGGPWLWIYDYTDANGYYEISTTAGTYYFDINGYYVNNYTLLCPNANYNVTLDSSNASVTVDFFLQTPPPVQDLSISMYPLYTPTPGFAYKTKVKYCNDGTIPMSGNVEVTYDNNLIWTSSGSASANGWSLYNYPLPDNHNASSNVLTYNFSNLTPGQCNYITITYETDPNAGLMPGDPINMDAVVNPIPGDVTPNNNVAYYQDSVTSSWDPNDKAVYPVGDITVDDNDHDYHIRFQNEGNANAWKVVVRDTLDENLNVRTIRDVSASHHYEISIEDDNILVFTFNNIQLPPKSVDEEGSQGFVSFRISQLENLPVGTKIENTAAIYFDFNPAIITNTVVNTIVEKVSAISDIAVLNKVKVYPNPSNGTFFIELENSLDVLSIETYNLVGTKILSIKPTNSKTQLDLSMFADGVYFLNVNTAQGKAVYKLIKNQ
ncbi:MAG: T9SS type A sorting domain-containing protein [Chitinophagales bacterium]|nr:T9SS type A sorting domain-containing protein [Chitinophagales bacterium]